MKLAARLSYIRFGPLTDFLGARTNGISLRFGNEAIAGCLKVKKSSGSKHTGSRSDGEADRCQTGNVGAL